VWPDALERFVGRARVRIRLRDLAFATGVGTAGALVPLALAWFGAISVRAGVVAAALVVLAAVVMASVRTRVTRAAVTAIVERQAPAFRNLLVTSAELADHPDRAAAPIRALVWEDAAGVASRTDVRRVLPLGRPAAVFGASIAAWLLAVAVLPRAWTSSPAVAIASGRGDALVTDVTVRVEPPAYVGGAAASYHDPDHIDALAGSRVAFDVQGRAARMTIADASGASHPLASTAAGRFAGVVDATADSYLAIEPVSSAGVAGPRHLITLTVRPDRPPTVRVTAPGKDLYVADATRAIDVTVAADDDLAIRSLRLLYTKVSGSGENFTFTEGEAPLRLTKTSDRSWTGQGALALSTLSLIPGDTLVYRAAAVDSLPSRAPVESDAFLVQVLSPSDVAMEGFATGDDRDKYALSEQMIIVKTEQLHAKKPALSADVLNDEAAGLSAMQRSVRAQFVFMLGGELEDIEAEAAATDPTELHEENEAAGEQDLLAGRMQNQGRQDVLIAIRRMSDAATSLAVADTTTALAAERAAVAALQRAFTKSRLILRTLSVRERIDPTRRLTGDPKGELAWRRDVPGVVADPGVDRLRRALDALTDLAGRSSFTAGDRARLTAVAESILQSDPGAAAHRNAASRVVAAADAVAAGRDADRVGELVTAAAVDVAAMVRRELRDAPARSVDPVTAALDGALADRVRRGGGRP
jgi:hypothetical protein